MDIIFSFIENHFSWVWLLILVIYYFILIWPITRLKNRKEIRIWHFLFLGPIALVIWYDRKQSKDAKPTVSIFYKILILFGFLLVVYDIIDDKRRYDAGEFDGTRRGRPVSPVGWAIHCPRVCETAHLPLPKPFSSNNTCIDQFAPYTLFFTYL